MTEMDISQLLNRIHSVLFRKEMVRIFSFLVEFVKTVYGHLTSINVFVKVFCEIFIM